MRAPGLALVLAGLAAGACAPTPRYDPQDCPTFSELEAVRVNPAGALDRHLRVEASFRVCPPVEGLAEIRRKRIELKHELIALLSAKTAAELEDPLRVEKLRRQINEMVNRRVLKRSRVEEVYITELELE
jgi:flagellar basal body-associated protein FliL